MTTATPEKPLPFITSWNEAFWEGTKQHQFLIERCANCQRYLYWGKWLEDEKLEAGENTQASDDSEA